MKKLVKAKTGVTFRVGTYASESITWLTDVEENLITDWGITNLKNHWFTDMTLYAVFGTSDVPNKTIHQLTQSGDIVTDVGADIPFTEADAVNRRLLQYDDGRQTRITNYISSTQVRVEDSYTITDPIWAVVGHTEDHTLTSPYTGSGFTNGYISTGYLTTSGCVVNSKHVNPVTGIMTLTNTRTLVFPALSEDVVFNEVGWAPTNEDGGSSNLFGKRTLEVAFSSGDVPCIEVSVVRVLDCSEHLYTNIALFGYSGDATQELNMDRVLFDSKYYSTISTSTGLSIAPTYTSILERKGNMDKIALFLDRTDQDGYDTTSFVETIVGEHAGTLTNVTLEQVFYGPLIGSVRVLYGVASDENIYEYEVDTNEEGPAEIGHFAQDNKTSLCFGNLYTVGEFWAIDASTGIISNYLSSAWANTVNATLATAHLCDKLVSVKNTYIFGRYTDDEATSYFRVAENDADPIVLDQNKTIINLEGCEYPYLLVIMSDEDGMYYSVLHESAGTFSEIASEKPLPGTVTRSGKIWSIPNTLGGVSFYLEDNYTLINIEKVESTHTVTTCTFSNTPALLSSELIQTAYGLYDASTNIVYTTDGERFLVRASVPVNGFPVCVPTDAGNEFYMFNFGDNPVTIQQIQAPLKISAFAQLPAADLSNVGYTAYTAGHIPFNFVENTRMNTMLILPADRPIAKYAELRVGFSHISIANRMLTNFECTSSWAQTL